MSESDVLIAERGTDVVPGDVPDGVMPLTIGELEDNLFTFMQKIEQESPYQYAKTNRASERRMRKLLRDFRNDVYIPYRDATLPPKE